MKFCVGVVYKQLRTKHKVCAVWDITQRMVVIFYRRFGTTYQSPFWGQEIHAWVGENRLRWRPYLFGGGAQSNFCSYFSHLLSDLGEFQCTKSAYHFADRPWVSWKSFTVKPRHFESKERLGKVRISSRGRPIQFAILLSSFISIFFVCFLFFTVCCFP